ncbi:SGNH hydrolase [Hypomontagnella monticulosa]|nr:SGNH hydrolase [Hypomontagnella monticulosa]
MRFLPILVAFQAISIVQAATVYFAPNSCTPAEQDIIREEMQKAVEMAREVANNVQQGPYYNKMFSANVRQNPRFASQVSDRFNRIANVANGADPQYVFTVTCDDALTGCKKKGWTAHMNDNRQVMNFCQRFFTETLITSTDTQIQNCTILELREAQRTRSAILIHECTHISYVMDGVGATGSNAQALDYAYGYDGCFKLAEGSFNRGCVSYAKHHSKAFCPVAPNSNVEGLCPPEKSAENADSYAFVAAGVYFSRQCNRIIASPPDPSPLQGGQQCISLGPISDPNTDVTDLPEMTSLKGTEVTPLAKDPPIPSLATAKPSHTDSASASSPAPTPAPSNAAVAKALESRQAPGIQCLDFCPIYDDYIVFDGVDLGDDLDIDGYVQFGDSFGAGMGTGSTSWDSCRVGSNNYGRLLREWLGKKIPFEQKVCSGDTTKGLNRQIDEWKNPKVPNVGTVSMGGNDLGFSDIVWYCVITPNTARLGSTNRKLCLEAEAKANALMDDNGPDGIRSKLSNAYRRILLKSGRRDFHLYVTGYIKFFNPDWTDCNKSTFHWRWARYDGPTDWPTNRIVFLTQDLRRELNGLVEKLNKVIEAAVNDANYGLPGGPQVHFVDVNPRFGTHRWCEPGPWHEPDPTVQSTWFFLSGWPDVPMDGQGLDGSDSTAAEISHLMQDGSIKLPDANTCEADNGEDADPYAWYMCRISQTIAEDPDGPMAKDFANANADIAKGDVNSQHIGFFTPTRQIKTFHPRSPGMVGYRDAIISVMQNVGQLS